VLAAAAFGLSSLVRGGAESGTASDLALLPCEAADPADSIVGRTVAHAAELGLRGFPTISVTPWPQSDTWAKNQVRLGLTVEDSVPQALAHLGASAIGLCTVSATDGDSIQVDLRLHTISGEFESHSVRLARTSDRTADSDPLVVELAGLLSEGSLAADRTFRPSDNIDALRSFYLADDYFLQDRFDEAEHFFRQAADADPEFALARWRQADARRWRAGQSTDSIDIRRLFNEHADRLGTRDSLLVWALIETPGPASFARFEEVLARLPPDAYATLLYGDELLHRGPLWGIPLDSAETVIDAATRLDPDFGPAWDHLAQLRIRLGMKEEARVAVERLAALEGQSLGDNPLPLAMIWRHGWLERFDPAAADVNRPSLEDEEAVLLAIVARQVRYGDLPRAQLELGRALVAHPATRRGDEGWHSGMIAMGLALAGLGQPEVASATFAVLAEQTSAAALFADQWAVVPVALGLEGFAGPAASDAPSRLADIASDSLAVPLDRARAAWSLALHASDVADAEAMQDFDHWRSLVASLVDADARVERLAGHLDALSFARDERWSEAIDASQALVAYDSVGNLERPFARAALYLHRGHWFAAAGQPDSAIAAWSWHLNTDLESVSPRVVQAGEVDGAFGSHARLRIARLASKSGREDLTERACVEAREVVRRWENAESGLADAVDEARRVAEVCQP
jgi:tetratricopeptide (TPR) repeat protein